MLPEPRGVPEEQLPKEPMRNLPLRGPVRSHGVLVEVLPERPAVTAPPLPVRHESEANDVPRAIYTAQVNVKASRRAGVTYSSSNGVCNRSDELADLLSRYSSTRSASFKTT